MSLQSARWLALSYFTYYVTFGIYLPFWALWLADKGYSTESIGLLLGIGMVARFSGNLYVTSRVRQPGSLLSMMRLLALFSLLSACGFLFSHNWLWLLLAGLLQGAHAAYYSFSAIYWQQAGYTSNVVGYLWSIGVVSEMIFFAFSNKLLQRWSIKGLLLFSIICGILRWTMLASTTELPWLVAAQILHCGTFSACHVAVIRFISTRQGPDVIRLQAVYASLCNGAGIALVTILAGVLYVHIQSGVFWVMLLLVLPTLGLLPGKVSRDDAESVVKG